MTVSKHLSSSLEDIEDFILPAVEDSYNFRFGTNDLIHVRTFGDFCNIVISKITQDNVDDCTMQQAFYKLSNAIVATKQIDKSQIKPDTKLSFIFPRQNRRKEISDIETNLGFKLNVLGTKDFIIIAGLIIALAFFITLFIKFLIGFLGLVITILGLTIITKTGKEFRVETVGQLADKMTQENYFKSRRNAATANRKEIVRNIEQLFINGLGLQDDVKEIPLDTLFVDKK